MRRALGSGALRTQVAIVGGGPAGMFLGHLLRHAGIDAVVLERRSRGYAEGRIRAGLLEHGTVETMRRLKLDERIDREGLPHGGINLVSQGKMFRIDLLGLTGSAVTVYGQSEVMKDLYDAAPARGLPVIFEADEVRLHDIGTDHPYATYVNKGVSERLDCDFVAGCDGSHGVSRACVPDDIIKIHERAYPFGWLGIMAEVPPPHHELIYCNHERGFALASMRSATRSRCYLQCELETKLEDWPDERFWDEFALRLGPEASAKLTRGPSFEKSIAPLRSFVAEPMRHGRLFLAGDAAHIVPPTGAKGMNLAVSDVVMLSDAVIEFYRDGSETALDGYSTRALARVWKAERFSWWYTGITHRFPETGALERRLQEAELDYIRGSRAAQTALAENYVGLPLE